MGTKTDPGAYDCLAAALPDEPYFTLLARDAAAPAAIEDWADLRSKMVRHREKPDTDWPMIAEARIVAMQMRDWKRANPNAHKSLARAAGEGGAGFAATGEGASAEVETPRRQDAKEAAKDEKIAYLTSQIAALVNVGLGGYQALEWFTKMNAANGAGDDFLNSGGYAEAVTIEANLRRLLNGASASLTYRRRRPAATDASDVAGEWPLEPWVVSGPGAPDPNEIGSIFQEGEVDVIVQVDPNRENPDAYTQSTARRICACINAMAGIEDPQLFAIYATSAMAEVEPQRRKDAKQVAKAQDTIAYQHFDAARFWDKALTPELQREIGGLMIGYMFCLEARDSGRFGNITDQTDVANSWFAAESEAINQLSDLLDEHAPLRAAGNVFLLPPVELITRRCRKCGCTEDRACEGGCSWVAEDLCSACLEQDAAKAES